MKQKKKGQCYEEHVKTQKRNKPFLIDKRTEVIGGVPPCDLGSFIQTLVVEQRTHIFAQTTNQQREENNI